MRKLLIAVVATALFSCSPAPALAATPEGNLTPAKVLPICDRALVAMIDGHDAAARASQLSI